METPTDPFAAMEQLLSASFQNLSGIGDAIAAGPSGPPVSSLPKGHPYRFTVQNGEIYDSANVKVSPESLERDIQKLQRTIKSNETAKSVAPKMVEFANQDLQKSLDSTQQFLLEYRAWKGK